MTATLDGVTKKKAKPTAEEKVAEELVRRLGIPKTLNMPLPGRPYSAACC